MKKVEISARIEEYFLSLGWTKAKFARAIGEYPQHLNSVFAGKLDPLKYVTMLVGIGCDENWLLTGELTKSSFSFRPGIKDESQIYTAEDFESLAQEIIILKAELYEVMKENKELKDKLEGGSLLMDSA